ncbi:hypothetical protein LIN78_00920 [Leeia sp. TBRC 13508]|uniref:GCVT N-terminal domain-containing protein n=1 Tax=Leeia speluncae TaxID=2884804 RepID=A0ABS8D1P6_9NEIS|nr:hypothetical protein [Leeia speluncae]MCB6182117.1 hypothetical protein [Leeia speluncae]
MNQDWQAFLAQQDAIIENGKTIGFGSSHLASTDTQATWLCDLSSFGLIHFIGEDTATFLQGQLSSDIKKISETDCVYSAQSTPKGRVLANFRIWRQADGYMLQLPSTLVPTIQKRLSMYILRAKSKASDLPSQLVCFGLVGQKAAELSNKVLGVTLAPMQTAQVDRATCIAISTNAFMWIAPVEQAQTLWDAFAKDATLAGTSQWELAEIENGTPWVTDVTQDEFVAQMLNLDKLNGGISFTKGCYTGQEIIARTQYLGKLKRRTYRVASTDAFTNEQQLYSEEMNGQASGRIVNAVQTTEGWQGLAVIQSSSIDKPLHIGDLNGATVTVKEPPYSLENETA